MTEVDEEVASTELRKNEPDCEGLLDPLTVTTVTSGADGEAASVSLAPREGSFDCGSNRTESFDDIFQLLVMIISGRIGVWNQKCLA